MAQELLITRQITRELIIEKLLSLIDLPIIEHLLLIDERNDIEYCEALRKFDNLLLNPYATSSSSSKTNLLQNSSLNKSVFSHNRNLNQNINETQTQLNKLLFSKSSLNIIQCSLAILNQKYDLAKCDL